ncbi:hypothetical protein DXA14_03985 [Hungatella hathewayi]|nr:hypothetical protein DXA14_03985 [Hungatella hathewayi]
MKLPKELLEVERKTVETVNLPSDNNHDPSNILYDQGTYYLWYTQHDNERPYDHFADCKIMCCTSKDGIHWEEGKDALLPAESGWDCAGVLTANVIYDKGRFYMFYTGVGTDFAEGKTTRRCCGLAAADTPDGPFERLGNEPVLQWEEEGSWDDEAVDDISAIFFQNRWLVYFKGSRLTEPDGDKTMLGLAWADTITARITDMKGIRSSVVMHFPYGRIRRGSACCPDSSTGREREGYMEITGMIRKGYSISITVKTGSISSRVHRFRTGPPASLYRKERTKRTLRNTGESAWQRLMHIRSGTLNVSTL